MSSNLSNSVARLKSQVEKRRKEPDILHKYNEVILEQLNTGIIEKVADLESAEKVYYMPQRAVIREDSDTTKVRIVYDASCKDKKSGTSLNDCLHVGPPLTPLTFSILLRFQESKIALVGDIKKAFLNIEIHPED